MNRIKMTNDLRLQFPKRYKRFGGSEFIVSQSGDSILLQPIQRKAWPSESLSSGKPLSMEEINTVVHSVRQKRSHRGR